jgi:hypothetical protein
MTKLVCGFSNYPYGALARTATWDGDEMRDLSLGLIVRPTVNETSFIGKWCLCTRALCSTEARGEASRWQYSSCVQLCTAVYSWCNIVNGLFFVLSSSRRKAAVGERHPDHLGRARRRRHPPRARPDRRRPLPWPRAVHATASEKDAKLAQKSDQLQPLTAVFPPECVGQLAYFGPI